MSRTITLALALITFSITHAAPPGDLLNKVPDWTNAIVVVDLKSILASPFAQKEQWDKALPVDILGSTLPFPKNTEVSMLASHLEPGSLRSQREVTLIYGGPFASVKDLSKLEGGAEELVTGVPAIVTSKNSYILSLSPSLMAVVSPANRQDTSRWIRFAEANKTVVLSSYLQQANKALTDGYHIIIALDMNDAIDPHLVKNFLAQSPLLKDKKQDIDALAKVLTSTRGLRIGVRFDQGIKATLAGDYGESIRPFASVLPAPVLSAFADMGAELDDFQANAAQIQDKSFLITTTLTTKGLRKLMQIVPPVGGPVMLAREPVPAKGAPAENPIQANQRYFKSIRDIGNEANTNAEVKNDMILAAQGYERAAARIDQLPVAGIDEDLVRYSNFVSSKLRAIADALRNAILEANAVESGRKVKVQVIPGYYMGSYNIGPWNPQNPGDPYSPGGLWIRPYIVPPTYNVQTNDAELQGKQAEALARGAKKRLEIWRQLTDETATLKKKLSIKYKVEF